LARTDDGRNAPAGFATRAIHEGYEPAEAEGALTPPIFMTSTYAFETTGDELFKGERQGFICGRTRNPMQALLEQRLASLEGGEAALAVASGIGAISAMAWTLFSASDEVVVDQTLYEPAAPGHPCGQPRRRRDAGPAPGLHDLRHLFGRGVGGTRHR
jgi:methionine-gamma-lyase